MKAILVAALVGLVGCGSSPTAPGSQPPITNPSSLPALADWSSLVGSKWTGTATVTTIDGSTVTWSAYLEVNWGTTSLAGVPGRALAQGFTNQSDTALLSVEQDRLATVALCQQEGHWQNLRASASALTVEVPDSSGCQYRAIRWSMVRQ